MQFLFPCFGGNDGTASAIAARGTSTYTYQWSPNGDQSNVATGLSSGNYIVTATDANGMASTTTTAIIDEPDALAMNPEVNSVACYGDSTGSIIMHVTGGTPGYSFHWNPLVMPYTALWNTSDTGASINVSPTTTTNYTVSVHDANNCPVAPASVSVPVYPPLSLATVSVPPMCEGGTVNLQAEGSGGNGGPYYYSWNDSSIFGATPVVLLVNDTTFTVTVSDGCSPNVITNDSNPVHTYVTPGEYDISLTIVTTDGCAASQNVNNAVTVFGFPVADFFQSADEVPEFFTFCDFPQTTVLMP
ncbi:MAG: SprB repeat-containing protein [Bacteroidetes bacterium]|nr:SprB repeat-containing protein [Bacteroidota bacterium]